MAGRLATVLRLRELREQQALGALGRARLELADAEGGVEAGEQAYEGRPKPTDNATLSPAALWSLARQGSGALERLAEAKAVREQAAAQVAQRMAAWQKASADTASAQRLEERQRLAEEFEAQKKAANELDELVVLTRGRGPRS